MPDDAPDEPQLTLARRGLVLGVTIVVAIGLVGLGAVFGARLLDKEPPPPPPAASPAPTPVTTSGDTPDDFVAFQDEQAGFSIAYPSGWERLQADDPQVRLVAAGPREDSMLVRAVRVGFDVAESGLDSVKSLTDRIVRSGKDVEILAGPTEIELGGLPGYFYFYSFKDDQSGQPGAHSHYFLFDRKKMISIVFQVIPLERFPDVAPTFDQIAATFQT